jgi:hypothetical protein
MIVELDTGPHPKAEILAIDFDKGTADFRWLDEKGEVSKIYSGVCMTKVAALEISEKSKTDITTAIKAESVK